jgi:hypothetical protein
MSGQETAFRNSEEVNRQLLKKKAFDGSSSEKLTGRMLEWFAFRGRMLM